MRRVMIVGQPGAGKSWLARRLGERTGLPVHHVDRIHWESGWVMRDTRQRIAMATEIETGDAWIFEGGLSATWGHRLARADTLIVLDIPLPRRAVSVFWRTLKGHGRTRADLPAGCPEQFDPEFWRWIWATRQSGQRQIRSLARRAGPHVAVHHLTSRAEMRDFLAGLAQPIAAQ